MLRLFSRRDPAATEDYLLVTYDSVRYDSYAAARTPVIDRYAVARPAGAQATFTLAAHVAMFHGFLPHGFCEEPYYNRFVKQLWRLPHRRQAHIPAKLSFPKGTRSIIDGFRHLGYYTCATAAMAWFRHPNLQEGWHDFLWTGIDGRRQVAWLQERVRRQRRPVFALINFGETHAPYRYGEGVKGSAGEAAAREARRGLRVKQAEWRFDEENWRRQVECTEFLDHLMGDLLAFWGDLGRRATVVVCGDHGDCFGEDGLYGHGFYHPKVMEVPLAIFEFDPEGER